MRIIRSFGFLVLCGITLSACALDHTLDARKLKLFSANALILDSETNKLLYSKNAKALTPIASITKLMTAMVVLDAKQPLDELLAIGIEDIDLLKGSHSRLRLGAELSRQEMLRLALMSSENRAAANLARHYPGGVDAFVNAMNKKALALGLKHTHFVDATGLYSPNLSTADALKILVKTAAQYELIKEYTTAANHFVEIPHTGQYLAFNNSNALVKSEDWKIEVSKTGFIREAGRCLVMMAQIANRPVVIVLLDSLGKNSRLGDANRIKHWLETGEALPLPVVKKTKRSKPIKRRV